jgi:hypothetical protein
LKAGEEGAGVVDGVGDGEGDPAIIAAFGALVLLKDEAGPGGGVAIVVAREIVDAEGLLGGEEGASAILRGDPHGGRLKRREMGAEIDGV